MDPLLWASVFSSVIWGDSKVTETFHKQSQVLKWRHSIICNRIRMKGYQSLHESRVSGFKWYLPSSSQSSKQKYKILTPSAKIQRRGLDPDVSQMVGYPFQEAQHWNSLEPTKLAIIQQRTKQPTSPSGPGLMWHRRLRVKENHCPLTVPHWALSWAWSERESL